MDIRVLRPSDIPHVQLANITNLPENYFCKYYLYHAMSWPQLSYVAVDVSFWFRYSMSRLFCGFVSKEVEIE
jgi:ribosomal protein S18 acetylase RimI-like enzyme